MTSKKQKPKMVVLGEGRATMGLITISLANADGKSVALNSKTIVGKRIRLIAEIIE